jgi:hypothetical protein
VGNFGATARLTLPALLVLGALAAPASALEGYEGNIEATPGGADKGKAECGNGEHAVSGGFAGEASDYAAVNKAVGGDAWVVKGDFAGEASVFVNCSRRLEPKVRKDTDAFGGSSSPATPTARCRAGWEAVAGGWSYKGPAFNSPVYMSAPSGRRWKVEGFNGGGNTVDGLTAHAYCLRTDLEVQTSEGAMPMSADASASVDCHAGRELLGGGFSTSPQPDFDNKLGPDPFVFGTGRTEKREWSALAHNYSSAAGTLHVFATCRP